MSTSPLLAWWAQRPLREKLLLAGGACAALIAGADALVTAPLEKKLKRTKAEVNALQAQVQSRRAGPVGDQASLREREAQLRERLRQAQSRSEQLHRRIAESARLPETLRAIVGTVGSVRVVELDLGADAESGTGAAGKLYRLPITLKVSGNWAELQQLLNQIERHADALQWHALSLDSGDWPAIQLTFKAHVWSHSPKWGAT